MSGNRGSRGTERPRVPRPVVFGFSILSWFVLFVLLPRAIGRRTVSFGWRSGRPSTINRAGLVPLAAGAVGLAWCLASHYEPGEQVLVSLVPETLIAKGPYRHSRNPMYVCEQAVLAGWTIYFGSPALLAGMGVLGAGMQYAVTREEQTLEDKFGDSWLAYASTVPRWL